MPANDYYDSTGTPSTNTLASSASMRAEFDAVETGFTAVQAALALKAVAADMTAALALKANATNAVLITPNIGTPSAGVVTNLTGTAAGVSIGGNAATATLASTVTTNANLTGHVTSVGNAAVLGSFTLAQLNAAISNADVATGGGTATGTNTGDQTNIAGNASTVTTNANLTGPITSTGNATAIASQTGTGTTFVMSTSPTIASPTMSGETKLTGHLSRAIPTPKTASFTVVDTDTYLVCNGTATITVTLPSAASYPGREIFIKNTAAFTVVSASANVVDLDSIPGSGGATPILPATAGKWALLVSNNTSWIIVAGNKV